MTLVNLVLTADRVGLITDTIVGTDARPVAFCPKFTLLPHITAVMAARGLEGYRHEASVFLEHTFLAAGVDTAVEVLPPFLVDLQERLEQRYHGHEDLIGELFIAGWSPSRGRFAGWRLGWDQGYEADELALDHTHIAPGGTDNRPLRHVDFGDRLIALAKSQHQVMLDELRPGRCPRVAGDLVMILLDRAGATVRKVARLPGYDELVAWITEERAAA